MSTQISQVFSVVVILHCLRIKLFQLQHPYIFTTQNNFAMWQISILKVRKEAQGLFSFSQLKFLHLIKLIIFQDRYVSHMSSYKGDYTHQNFKGRISIVRAHVLSPWPNQQRRLILQKEIYQLWNQIVFDHVVQLFRSTTADIVKELKDKL